MFAKQKLTTAVGIALGASVVALSPVQSALAGSALFQHIVASPSVTTVLSIINQSGENYTLTETAGGTNLHYRLYYKPITGNNAVDNALVCEEVNTMLPTSKNDIQTIDIGGVFGAGTAGVLFNDPSVNNRWAQSLKRYDLAAPVKPMRGYLVVDNADSGQAVTVSGEAFVFEFASGAAWGYQAFANGLETVSADPEFWYWDRASASPSTVAVMPFAEFSTSFIVMVPDNFFTGTVVPAVNNYQADLLFGTGPDNAYVMFDRDENPVSGSRRQSVTCVGRVDVEDLTTVGVRPLIPDGGWGSLWNRPVVLDGNGQRDDEVNQIPWGLISPYGGAIITKLEYNLGNSFNGEPADGVFNNAFTLRPPVQFNVLGEPFDRPMDTAPAGTLPEFKAQ